MQVLQLLEDIGASTIFELFEDVNSPGVIKGRGPFGKAGRPTANGRLYSIPLMEREIKKLQPKIKARKCYMELDHPGDGKTKLSRVAAILTELYMEEDGVIIGVLEVVPTEIYGKSLAALINSGCSVDVSSRGFGSVKLTEQKTEDGRQISIVQDDFSLKTWDCVAEGAAGEFAEPVYTKEGIEALNRAPAVGEEKDNDLQEMVDQQNASIGIITALQTKVDLLEANEVEMHVKIMMFASAAKRAGYELFLERKLRGESVEIRDEVISLIGEVTLYEDLDGLSDKLSQIVAKVNSVKEFIENKDQEIGQIKNETKNQAVSTKRALLQERIEQRKLNRDNRLAPLTVVEDDEELCYEDNDALQAYAARTSLHNGFSADEFAILEQRLVVEEVISEEEIDEQISSYMIKKQRSKAVRSDVSPKKGLFEDVEKGLAGRQERKSASLIEGTNEGHSSYGSGADVLGVSMDELAGLSRRATGKQS